MEGSPRRFAWRVNLLVGPANPALGGDAVNWPISAVPGRQAFCGGGDKNGLFSLTVANSLERKVIQESVVERSFRCLI
jgi:hypothetical protein